jgi:hypothetical protein
MSPYLAKYTYGPSPLEQHHEIENKNTGSPLSPSAFFFKTNFVIFVTLAIIPQEDLATFGY